MFDAAAGSNYDIEARFRHLEGAPGFRALIDVSARQLCELLEIELVEYTEFGIDLRDLRDAA